MTNNLGTATYSIGGDFDTWGAKFVADMAILSKMAGAALAIPDTSGTVTLDVTATQNFAFLANGSGAGQVDVRIPDAISRFGFWINDRPSGAITVRCAAGGTSLTLAAGERRLIYSDGTNCVDLTVATIAIAGVSGLQAALDAKQDVISVAAVADILANASNKFIQTDEAWSSTAPVDLGNLTGNLTLDFNTFVNAKGALTGNITFNTISNAKHGQSGVFEFTHSGGARTLTLGSGCVSAGAAGVTLSTGGAGVKDRVGYYVQDDGKVLVFAVALAVG